MSPCKSQASSDVSHTNWRLFETPGSIGVYDWWTLGQNNCTLGMTASKKAMNKKVATQTNEMMAKQCIFYLLVLET